MQERGVAEALAWDGAKTLAAPADGAPAAVQRLGALVLDISFAEDFVIMLRDMCPVRLIAEVRVATGALAAILAKMGNSITTKARPKLRLPFEV